MLYRHILGYGPANAVPALVSFISVYIFTRSLSPEEYGQYALANTVALLCQAVLFYWLQVAAMRFAVADTNGSSRASLSGTIYRAYFVVAGATCIVAIATFNLASALASLASALTASVGLLFGRSLVAINQAFHRSGLRVLRYNLVECSQSLCGFVFAISAVHAVSATGTNVVIGLALGSCVALIADLPQVSKGLRTAAQPGRLNELLHFSAPLTICFALNFILSTFDRILIEHYLDTAAVGVYAVSYNIMDRLLASVFVAISLAALPLAIRALEREGANAAREQMQKNGTAILALALPMAAGLIAANQQICAVLIGPNFREAALHIAPWIAVSSLLAGMQLHFFDHAFLLGKRTRLMIWSSAPGAAVNIVLNVILLPHLGVMGAVYATVAGYAVTVLCSALLGRYAFRIAFPWRSLARIAPATAVMFACMRIVDFPRTAAGLAAIVCTGILAYVLSALVFDIAGVRGHIRGTLKRGRAGR